MTNHTESKSALAYAGDVTPEQAWQWVQSGKAVLVDVRSDAERTWVGFVPEAKALREAAICCATFSQSASLSINFCKPRSCPSIRAKRAHKALFFSGSAIRLMVFFQKNLKL